MMERLQADVPRRVAALRNADEIVVGWRRWERLRSALGSVLRAVMRAGDRPVPVVPATPTIG